VTGVLAGRRALVVGAGSGIGRAVIEAFAAEGAAVGALEVSEEKARDLATAVPGAVVVCGDATSWADARRAVAAAVDAFGGLDVLVACVGRFDFYLGLGDLDGDVLESAFDEAFGVNVLSHLLAAKAALPALTASRGSIILTVSTSSFSAGRGGVLYVATKFALRGVVASLALELAPAVRVNGVAPGGTLGTDLRGLGALGQDGRRLDDDPDRAERLAERTPLEIALTASDQAASYVFLASDAAKGMTGSFLHPDGGMQVHP
jgi:NAD(P)-dependent dehydrogenase (short-subunit alcohol dehydrogenase family)